MEPGIYHNLSNAEYHGGAGISKSGLDLIHRSPLHFNYAKTAANDNTPTPAQAIGTAFHMLVLEPALFISTYTLALRPSDVPDAIDGADKLIAMIEKLNETRLAKLPTTGTKGEQVARIIAALGEIGSEMSCPDVDELESMNATQLKAFIEELNKSRPGKLKTGGTIADLAQTLRDAGENIKLWQEVKAEWLENNGQRTILTAETWDQVHGMREAIMTHPAASKLLNSSGTAETSALWIDEPTGELCRIRPDFWREDGVIVDLKTTDDASLEGFAKSIANWRYHVQAAFYMDGAAVVTGEQPKGFVFVAVEKKPPYAVGVYVLDPTSLEIGRAEYRADLSLYAECKRAEKWNGYGDLIQKIELPGFALNKGAKLLESA